jgi:uncharacterized protein (DUF362 family)
MSNYTVSIVRYEEPLTSVRRAVELCGGLDHLPAKAKVFIKPNIVFWSKSAAFPKWGVITTSRVVEDMVVLLKERGIDDITIGEGTVTTRPKDLETPAHAFESLGYNRLKKRYGLKVINVFERPFRKLDLGGEVVLNFNADCLDSDFVVNLPVLKTHAQAVVTLGIKNLKGLIDVSSRKKCHNADDQKNLHYWIARLADKIPPSLTLLDGIYTNERGPGIDGRIHRSNILAASSDIFSADLVGSKILGHDPVDVPHLVLAARHRNRPLDCSDIRIVGERIEDVARYHDYFFAYNEEGSLPLPMANMGIKGLSFKKYDLTMCTYCSGLTRLILLALAKAWEGTAWDDVEILTGKAMKPTPGKRKTILLGKCMVQANRNNPDIQEAISVKGCPPSVPELIKAFQAARIPINPAILEDRDLSLAIYMKKYAGKPEFEESFFSIS